MGMDPRGALQEEQKQFHPALLSSSNRFEAASLQGSCGDRRRGVFPKCLLGRRSTDLEKPAEREPAGPLNSCSGPGSSAASLQQRPSGSTRGGRGPTPPPAQGFRGPSAGPTRCPPSPGEASPAPRRQRGRPESPLHPVPPSTGLGRRTASTFLHNRGLSVRALALPVLQGAGAGGGLWPSSPKLASDLPWSAINLDSFCSLCASGSVYSPVPVPVPCKVSAQGLSLSLSPLHQSSGSPGGASPAQL